MKQFEVKRKQIEYLSLFFEIVILWCIGRRVGMEGMGFFLVAWVIYLVFWAVLAESLPDALGRMIRFRKSRGQYKSVQNLKEVVFVWQLCMGILGSLVMFFGGTILAEKVFHCVFSKLMIWILSPLVLFRSLSALLLGYTQGEGTELPAVVASVLRPLFTYVIGFFSGEFLKGYGEKVSFLLKQEHYTAMYTGAGWCFAMTVSEIVVVLVTLLSYLGVRRKRKSQESEGLRASDSFGMLLRTLYGNMGNKIWIRLFELFPVIVGMAIYYSRETGNAFAGFGSYFIGYLSIGMAMAALMHAVTIPLWGRVAGFLKNDEKRLACVCFQGGIHLHVSLGLWLSVSISVLAAQVGSLVGFTSPNLVKILTPGSFWILFAALSFYFSRMLMRLGKSMIAVGMGVLCDVLFLMIYLILWSNANMGILSLMYAALITTAVYALLLGALCVQMLGVRMNWLRIVIVPIVSGAVTGFLEALGAKLLGVYLGNALTVLLCMGVGFFLFWSLLLLLRNFKQEELSVIPMGKMIHSLGSLLGVL